MDGQDNYSGIFVKDVAKNLVNCPLPFFRRDERAVTNYICYLCFNLSFLEAEGSVARKERESILRDITTGEMLLSKLQKIEQRRQWKRDQTMKRKSLRARFSHRRCLVAYTCDGAQPAKCTIISDRPMYYVHYEEGD